MATRKRDDQCSVQNCLRNKRARGWCNLHYKRWKRNGDPNTTVRRSADHSPGQMNFCSTEGCDRLVNAEGLCFHHRNGTARRVLTDSGYRVLRSPDDVFKFVDVGDCWQWTGSCDKDGYGKFRFNNRHFRAHRFVWELLVGPIPDGLVIDHLCRNTGCVNPDHLEPVTNEENLRRGLLPEKVWRRSEREAA